MSMLVQNKYHRLAAVALASATLLFSGLVTAVRAQQPSAVHSSHAPASANDEASLTEQLKQLQSKVAQLEAALKQNHQGMAGPPAPSGGMAGQAMPMMDDELGGMQPGQGMQGMGMGSGMMQREMSGMSSMQSGQGMNGMGMMRQRGMMSGQGMPGMGMDGMSGMGGGRHGSDGNGRHAYDGPDAGHGGHADAVGSARISRRFTHLSHRRYGILPRSSAAH